MKKLLILLFLLLPFFLVADEKKYDFTVTISAENKTLKEATEMFKEFEKVAEKYKVKIDFELKEGSKNKIIIWDGLNFTPTNPTIIAN